MRRDSLNFGRILILVLAIALLANPASALDGDEGPFGLGISAGEPTGITAKYFFGENVALDALVGASFFRETALHIHTDVLWHFDDQPGVNDNPWMFMFGFGFRYKFGDEAELAGLRVPIGFTYDLGDTNMVMFVEGVPVFNFGSEEDFTANVAAGVHYFFD